MPEEPPAISRPGICIPGCHHLLYSQAYHSNVLHFLQAALAADSSNLSYLACYCREQVP